MMKTPIQLDALPPEYPSLRAEITAALEEGRERTRRLVEYERIRMYWTVGSILVSYIAKIEPQYGDNIVKNLEVDIGLDRRILYETIAFRNWLQNVPSSGLLTWSHYRRLLAIPDTDARSFYHRAASENGWSVRELDLQISDGAYLAAVTAKEDDPEQAKPTPHLVAKRGEPWIYRIIDKPGVGRVLDQGFRVFEGLADHDDPGFAIGQLIRSERADDGSYRIVRYDKRRRVFSYRATVAEIIDGDTLWVTIDCGFGTYSDQKIRLRGIDTPELKEPAGVRARDHVAKVLGGVDQIVVSTTKLDLYDRYLSDVFYLPNADDPFTIARKGTFLNRELVEMGLARYWLEEPVEW